MQDETGVAAVPRLTEYFPGSPGSKQWQQAQMDQRKELGLTLKGAGEGTNGTNGEMRNEQQSHSKSMISDCLGGVLSAVGIICGCDSATKSR